MTALNAPILVLAELDENALPTASSLELVAGAATLTDAGVIALALASLSETAARQLAAAGATALKQADLGESRVLAGLAADVLVAALRVSGAEAALIVSDYRGKEIAGRAAVLLGSAATADVAEIRIQDGVLHTSKLVLSGSWETTTELIPGQAAPIIAMRPGAFLAMGIAEPVLDGELPPAPAVEMLEVEASAPSARVRLLSREVADGAAGPELTEARTVVVGGRGVDGDFDLVRSLATPLGAAIGATRVSCDEGWIERSAQVGQTGVSIAPRLYIGLGVSGAVHHTSGIQGAGTIVAICDDSEAPIFEIADYGVVGDVTEVVPQLVEELARLQG